jgi:type IV pilus assembly protein PilB
MTSKKNGNGRKMLEGIVTDVSFLSMKYRIPTIALDQYEIDATIIALVPKELCEKHRVLPVSRPGSSLIVAMVDPVDGIAIDALSLHTGLKVEPVIASDAAIAEAITKYYG